MTIAVKDRNGANVDIASSNVGGQEVTHNIITDPSGNPIGPATQATLAQLLAAAQAIQAAADALNTKTVAVNTAAIGGTVSVSNFPSGSAGLTDAELRASPLQVTGTFYQATQPVSFTWSGLTDTQLRASPVDVAVSGTVPVSGTFWQATQPVSFTWDGLTDAQLRATPVETTHSAPPFMRVGFAEVGSGLQGLAASELTVQKTGAGQAVSQSGGNLVITTGTTANSETVIRSVDTFSGSLLARFKVVLSQRIVNQTFRIELADQIGQGLAYVINSATSVTVTFPVGINPFTAINVGQSLRLSRISGAAGIPGRYAIASTSGDTVTFTVAGWPASGSGTLDLFGWNSIWAEYSGTVATNLSFDAARRGWASGATVATINTTASPGHVAQIAFDVLTAGMSDSLVASNTGYQWANRASRIENIPDPDVPMFLFITVQNGNTAPASTTTMTVGFINVEDQGRQKVRIASSDPVGSHAMPVQVMGGNLGSQTINGTVTATVGASISGGTISPLTVAGASAEASSAKTATGNSASALTNASGTNAHFIVNVSASSGTTPTLVVRVQIQDPVSSTWVDLPGAATASITSNGATLLSVNNLPRTYRLAWVIGGTTPSFTFSVGMLPVV